MDGSLFLFVNRRGDRLKMLWWDRDGLAQFYKRLESGTFEMLRPDGEAATVEIDATELAMLLSGVSLASAKRRKRYSSGGLRSNAASQGVPRRARVFRQSVWCEDPCSFFAISSKEGLRNSREPICLGP